MQNEINRPKHLMLNKTIKDKIGKIFATRTTDKGLLSLIYDKLFKIKT